MENQEKTIAVKKVKTVSKAKAVKTVKAEKPKTAKVKKEVKRTVDNFNRNFGRIKFAGEALPKGKAVLALVAAFVEKNKPTAAELKEAFPDTLVKNYGVVQELSKAKKFSMNGKTRYFLKKDELITTKDGKVFGVTSQISTDNVKGLIKTAKTLGFTMTQVKSQVSAK